jgi:hypothetical protein
MPFSRTHSIAKAFLICLITAGLAYACSPSEKQPDTLDAVNHEVKFDSLHKPVIDGMVDSINAGLRKVGPPQQLAFPLYNEKDTMLYWILDNQSARISIEFSKGTEVMWPTFFVFKGDLVFVRYRYANYDTTVSKVFEHMIYLKDGEVAYCEERGQNMAKGDVPASLRIQPYTMSTRTTAEIKAEYSDYWEAVKAHMQKNGVLPDFIKR